MLKRVRGDAAAAGDVPRGGDRLDMIVYVIEAVALIVLGRLLYDVAAPARVVSLDARVLLGALAFAALGIALTGADPLAATAPPRS